MRCRNTKPKYIRVISKSTHEPFKKTPKQRTKHIPNTLPPNTPAIYAISKSPTCAKCIVSWSLSTWPCTIFVAFVALTASKSWEDLRKKINQQMLVVVGGFHHCQLVEEIIRWLKSGSVSFLASAIWGFTNINQKKTHLLMVVICSCLVLFTVPSCKVLTNRKLWILTHFWV